MSKTWEKLTAHDKVIAVHVDISNNALFAGMSGVVYVGDVKISQDIPTAGTDGRDVWYGEDFVNGLTRKQLRFVVLHEAMHKALQHCTNYKAICDKYPQLSNIAMDYVVNATIEETDPNHTFIEFTTEPPPLLDAKYKGWSFVEVLQDILRNVKVVKVSGVGEGDGDGDGMPVPLDEHVFGKIDKESEAGKKLGTQIDDALRQGKILAEKLAGKKSLGSALDRLTQKRDTNWREHMREWVTALCEGDEYSRFAPPNKRLAPQGILMPSHFSEATGELIVACDTSGSMGGIYPTVFGEIARIAQNVNPDGVRVIWWDSAVCGEQLFKPHEFNNIATLLKPSGGGGTSPNCVVQYIRTKKYQPKGVVWLTDGYLDGSDGKVDVPALWGVVDNDSFVPPQGKAVRIYSN